MAASRDRPLAVTEPRTQVGLLATRTITPAELSVGPLVARTDFGGIGELDVVAVPHPDEHGPR